MSPTRPRQVHFKRSNSSRRRSNRSPPLSLSALRSLRLKLVEGALEPSTRRGYKSSMKHWTSFLRTYPSLPHIPTVDSLSLFVAYLSRRVKHGNKVLSALASHFKSKMPEWEDYRSHPLVKETLRGAVKANASPTKRARALLITELTILVRRALESRSYDDLLVAAMATLAFGCLHRLGELVEPSHKSDRRELKYCRRDGAVLIPDIHFSYKLAYHKADRDYRGSDVVLVAENSGADFNFVKLVGTFLSLRDRQHGKTGFLFLREDGSLPSRKWFLARLASAAPGATGHSLRAGGATFFANRGVEDKVIKRMGRWRSDSWEAYIRNTPELAAALQRRALRPSLV